MQFNDLTKEQKDLVIERYCEDIDIYPDMEDALKTSGVYTFTITIQHIEKYFNESDAEEQKDLLS